MDEKKSLKSFFHKSHFSLEYSNPERFVKGPWHPGVGPPVKPLFLIFRVLMASLFVGVLLWSTIMHWRSGRWLIFATNWSFAMCCVQAVLACYIVVKGFLAQRNNNATEESTAVASSGSMPTIYKVYWITYNMGMPVAFSVTALYWGVVYRNGERVNEGPPNFPLNVMMHAGNSILCLAEIFIGGPPSKLAHALYPFLLGICYVVFNILYWAFGGLGPFNRTYIYKALDWEGNAEKSAAIAVAGLTSLIVLHCLVCGLTLIRKKLIRLAYPNKDSLSNIPLPEINNGKLNTAYMP